MVQLISQADYASQRGVSRQAISRLVKRKIIPLVEGKIDPQIADIKIGELDPSRSKILLNQASREKSTPPAPASSPNADPAAIPSYQQSRALREQVEAARAQLEYEKLRGNLVEIEGVKRAATDVARIIRDTLLGCAVRIGPGMIGLTDPAEATRRLEAEMRRALDAAAKSLQTALEKLAA